MHHDYLKFVVTLEGFSCEFLVQVVSIYIIINNLPKMSLSKNVMSMNEVFDESSKEKQMIDRMDPEAAKRRKLNEKKSKRKYFLLHVLCVLTAIKCIFT